MLHKKRCCKFRYSRPIKQDRKKNMKMKLITSIIYITEELSKPSM